MTTVLSLVGADARRTNWQFLLPATSRPTLVLEDGDLPAGSTATDPGIVAPDLGHWAPQIPAEQVLLRLCDLVPAGGWLLVGFSNPWHHPLGARHSGLGLTRAVRRMHARGLVVRDCYAALPDNRRAAVLVPVRRRGELDDLLRRVPVTYVDHDARAPRAQRRLRQLALPCVVAGPHRVRVALLPSYFVLAWRPL